MSEKIILFQLESLKSLHNDFGNALPPVGGIVPPVGQLKLLAPYIGVCAIAGVAAVAAIAIKRRKA